MTRLFSLLRSYNLVLAWFVVLVATASVLVAQYAFALNPCELCWYQRACLFPMVVILGVAAFRDDRRVRIYVAPLAGLGALFALYHYLEQRIPALAGISPCTAGVPCNHQYINWLGFISFPLMSLVTFVLVGVLVLLPESGIEPPRPV